MEKDVQEFIAKPKSPKLKTQIWLLIYLTQTQFTFESYLAIYGCTRKIRIKIIKSSKIIYNSHESIPQVVKDNSLMHITYNMFNGKFTSIEIR